MPFIHINVLCSAGTASCSIKQYDMDRGPTPNCVPPNVSVSAVFYARYYFILHAYAYGGAAQLEVGYLMVSASWPSVGFPAVPTTPIPEPTDELTPRQARSLPVSHLYIYIY